MSDGNFDEAEMWRKPYVTPMIHTAWEVVADVIRMGASGLVIYAPTGTGKSAMCESMLPVIKSIRGNRGQVIESDAEWVEAYDRLVLSEGGFWEWLLTEFNHGMAGKIGRPFPKRKAVYQYLIERAGKSRSGRLILFIDEAQRLEETELGWLVDIANALRKKGLELFVILVGSYHLQSWKKKLEGKKHEHVKRRFFTHEHPFTGLTTLEHFKSALRRYDVDATPFDGKETVTEHYFPTWFKGGGRLEKHASSFYRAFWDACPKRAEFEVQMVYFTQAVKAVLDAKKLDVSYERLKEIVAKVKYKPPGLFSESG